MRGLMLGGLITGWMGCLVDGWICD